MSGHGLCYSRAGTTANSDRHPLARSVPFFHNSLGVCPRDADIGMEICHEQAREHESAGELVGGLLRGSLGPAVAGGGAGRTHRTGSGSDRGGARGPTWEQRDMRELPWPKRFDGAFCVGNSFGYLDDDGNEAFLRAVAATLKPGGRLLLETPMVLEQLLGHLEDRLWWKVGPHRSAAWIPSRVSLRRAAGSAANERLRRRRCRGAVVARRRHDDVRRHTPVGRYRSARSCCNSASNCFLSTTPTCRAATRPARSISTVTGSAEMP